MYELINSAVEVMAKDGVASKVKPKTTQSLRRAITELAAQENARVPAERRVTLRDVETVAARSLNKTANLERSSRFFAAYKEVASFISLAVTGTAPTRIATNRDLLPVGHPLSTRKHAMTASAYSEAVARWIAADPRIHDDARALVAAAYSLPAGTVEYTHAVTRMLALQPGMVPQEFLVSGDPAPITASFVGWLRNVFGGGNSRTARSLRAQAQLRDREGKFAEQGGGIQFYVRMPDGTYKSKVGKRAGNAANGTDFLVEMSGDPDIADGIISVPANITKAIKAIIPGDDAGAVSLPDGVEAVDIKGIERKDFPDGWKLVKEKGEGESGPDKIFATDDGYEVEYWEPGNYGNPELQKAYQFNKSLAYEVPGQPVGNFTERVDTQGNRNMKAKFDKDKPFFALYRVETPETQRQAVVMAQRWSDIQESAEADQDKFEKYYDAAEKVNAEKAEKKAKADLESKAADEALEKKAAEVEKQNELTRQSVKSNLEQGLDPYGNKIPDGWTATLDEDELNPGWSVKKGDKAYVTTLIDKKKTVTYQRTEQGYTGNLSHTEDGGLKGLYQNEGYKDWDDANEAFKETVKADVDARREAALDAIEKYDESGEIRDMIENGASPDEVLEKLREDEIWNQRENDYDTRGYVDLPQAAQKEKWKAFEKDLNAIINMPPEFTPFDEEKADEVKAELPEQAPKPAAPAKEEPKDVEWILPDGAFKLYKADEYEPEGRIDEDSPDFTDDPKVLANKFGSEELKSALAQALIGKSDFVSEFLEELDEIDDEGEGKPGPKKKKPAKIKNASGYGKLDFSQGDEYVPAEAIYGALKEQGEDADMITAEIYDAALGESKNVDMLESLRSPEEVKAQEPSVLIDEFDKDVMDIVEANENLAKPDVAAVTVAQINEAIAKGEPNVFIRDIAVDINSLQSPANLSAFLGKYIGWAIGGSGDEKQAFRGLWGILLSADGGYTKPGTEDSMLFNAVSDALQAYNGSEPTIEEIDNVFAEFGYFADLIRSKGAVIDGDETLNMDDSLAGAMHRLLAAMSETNKVTIYRGIQVPLDSDDLARFTEGGVISLDPRSFTDDKALAGKFAGAFGGNADKAAVIFTIPAGKGTVAKIDNISMFEDEREQLAWGNFKVVSVKSKVNPAGKTLYNIELEALDKRGQVLEGYDDDYAPLLLTNDEVELPGEYYTPSPEPYAPMDEKGEGVPEEFDDSPLYIAQLWATEDLVNVFISGIEDGTGKALLVYPTDDEYEASVDIEAIRDALQIQGIDTNEILKDVANTGGDVEATDEEPEAVEAESEGLVADIANAAGSEWDMEGWKQVGPQLGSNKGGFYEDAEGNRYYVKEPKSDLHGENEVLASALYRAAGINAAEIYIGSSANGKKMTFSPDIKNSKQDLEDKLNDPEYLAKLQEGFAVDAWLANWDVAGLVFDNVMSDGDGNPVRVDPGGALLFRAQGAPKGQMFGNEANELDSLRDPMMNPQSAKIFGSMTEEQQKESARKLLDISHTDIDTLVDSIIPDEEKAQELKDKLKARRNFILERYGLLGDDTSLIAETTKIEDEAPQGEATPEPEQPAAPPVETPSESVTNPYVTSDGVPIEPGMKLKYKKTGEVVDFVKYDKGNSSYVYVKLADGSIKVKSTKQLESINGNGNGGPGGEEPTPEPEAPSAPEVTPEPTPEVTPEPTPEPEVTVQKAPVVIDTTGSVDDAVNQLKTAIENNETVTFFYNGKVRYFKPMSIWENQKNGKINVYGEDLGDEGKKKNFTVQLMDVLPDESPNKPEAIEAQAPTTEPEPKKLQSHAQWIKDIVAQQGKTITDEQAIEIRDMINANDLLGMNWSAAEDSDLIEAITEAVGADLSGLADDDSIVEPETTPEQTTEVPDAEPVAEQPVEAPVLEPGAEVTDKKGNKGTILKGPNKDNYVFVQFEDGKTGWRSVSSVSTTGEFNDSVKKAAPKKVTGKITPAGTKAVFVENPAGWDTSDFENVPALTDAIALVQNPDDKFAAMKGASAAIDADSIEDLDVRIMRVRDKDGNDGLRFKFKLTAWAGNARVKQLMDMTPEQLAEAGATKGSMTVDRIDIGPDGVGQVSKDKNAYQGDGVVWTITTPDGITIKIYRGNYDASSKLSSSKYGQPRAFHNMVQIQAPADVTNEQIADALKQAGVSDVRPATKEDARILVENRLMSIFDSKVDATKNPKGTEREESLKRVKDKYGITADDVVITTGASGRIETRLSPEGAQKIVDATGSPTAIQHSISVPGFYGSGDEFEKRTDWLTNLLATPQGGLLSTTTRWTEGIGTSGMSSAADVGTGGADYVFTKPVKVADAKTYGTSGMVMYFDPVKVYQRLDFYANSYDAFGKRQANQDVINAAKVGAYELMFKHRLSFDDLDSIVVSNQATRTAIIQKLRQMGIDEIGGRPLEAVIIIGSQVSV